MWAQNKNDNTKWEKRLGLIKWTNTNIYPHIKESRVEKKENCVRKMKRVKEKGCNSCEEATESKKKRNKKKTE